MKHRLKFAVMLAGIASILACAKNDPPPVVSPEPLLVASDDNAARDSARRVEEARRDSLARAERLQAERAAAIAAARASLLAPIYFAYDQAQLRDDSRWLLDGKHSTLRAMPEFRLKISGHADERGSDEYNLALGQRRAVAAKQYLVDQGIEPSRLEVVSYGEERPVCTAASEACWSRNRRAEFEIVSGVAGMGSP